MLKHKIRYKKLTQFYVAFAFPRLLILGFMQAIAFGFSMGFHKVVNKPSSTTLYIFQVITSRIIYYCEVLYKNFIVTFVLATFKKRIAIL